jgi:hypothetical protein
VEEQKTLEEAKYLGKDLIEGDESVASRLDFSDMDYATLQQALKLIMDNPHVSDTKKKMLLTNSWKLYYRRKPPTIEEFLSQEWIGPTATSLFTHVRETLTEFWQPDSQYRNLILATSIGTGKALPDSSPVIVNEEPCLNFELEDGTILTFGEEDLVLVYNNQYHFIKAKEIEKTKINDFPVSWNYLFMRLYNMERIPEFKTAFEIDSYDQLITFFQEFKEDFFKERNIFTHKHHIVPRSEGGGDHSSNLVNLPFYFHIKAHYLRGKEHEQNGNKRFALKNYKAVIFALGTKHLPKIESEVMKNLQFVVETLERRNFFEEQQFFIKKEGGVSKKIFDEEWEYYKSLGWEKGRNFKDPTGKKWVHKGEKSFLVFEEDVEIHLENGFSEGMYVTENMKEANPKRASYSTLGTVWINKDGERKCVKKEEIDIYLENGWNKGSASTTTLGQTWEWKEENKGRKKFTNGEKFIWAKECPEGYWPAEFHLKGKHWYTDGNIVIAADSCPEGFVPGRFIKEERKWYTNGEKDILSSECPEGFWFGKTVKQHWYTNGEDNTRLFEQPEGFWPGQTNKTNRSWYTNGKEDIMSTSCPEGFWRGRTYFNGKEQ